MQNRMMKVQQALDSKSKEFPLAALKMAQLEERIDRLVYNKIDNQLHTNNFSEKLAHLEQILNVVAKGKFLIPRISRLKERCQ
eukprot:110269-Ditylum_brightwellii.AAC.1